MPERANDKSGLPRFIPNYESMLGAVFIGLAENGIALQSGTRGRGRSRREEAEEDRSGKTARRKIDCRQFDFC
jgi:hypothetical protein